MSASKPSIPNLVLGKEDPKMPSSQTFHPNLPALVFEKA